MYDGEYHGSKKHQADLEAVLDRSVAAGLSKIIITSTDLETLLQSVKLIDGYNAAGKYENLLYTTCGVHPTRAAEFEKHGNEPQKYLQSLIDAAIEHRSKIVAVGEFGLDYDRLRFCDKKRQLKYFELQFELADKLQLPLFLHSRQCATDFIDIVTRNRHRFSTGVVHSFTGTVAEAQQLLDMDLYIGINGCSMKTEENLEVVKSIPLEKMMIETDAPWCEIRPTHAGFKHVKTPFPTVKREKWVAGSCIKGRNEPCHIVNVIEIIAALKGMEVSALAEILYQNTMKVFFGSN